MIDVKHIAKYHAAQNIPLNFDEAYELGRYLIEGCNGNNLAQVQTVALLSALHNIATYNHDGESDHFVLQHECIFPRNASEQIAGLCAAVFKEDIEKSEFGYIKPNVPYVIDNCGMGGDLITTANVSTISALIAATDQIYMLKHGSPANADQGRHGSSDFVSMLGIDTLQSKESLERSVELECFGYSEALDTRYKQIHQQTHSFAMLPHMNDIIGPITNPAYPGLMTKRILGINHIIPPKIVAEAYKILNEKGLTNLRHGLFVRGYLYEDSYEGVDEVSICEGGTLVAELKDGEITERKIFAEDFGIKAVDPTGITPPTNMSKGDFSLGILREENHGPARRMVLANAALLFYLDGRSESLSECYQIAESVFQGGRVYEKAQSLTPSRISQKRGAFANLILG